MKKMMKVFGKAGTIHFNGSNEEKFYLKFEYSCDYETPIK